MKPQDILFIVALIILLWKANAKFLVGIGLLCLVLAIPLFHFWIFFTAERLVWYAAAFFFVGICLHLFKKK